jgi:hypothetical protein
MYITKEVQKVEMASYFSQNRLLAAHIFYELMNGNKFFMQPTFLHFADSEACSRCSAKL